MRRTLDAGEKRDWLRLARTPSVGPVTFAALIARYDDAAAALDALPGLARRAGGTVPRIPGAAEIERELERIDRLSGRILAAIEPDYPDALAALDSPPPVLTVIGDPGLLARDCAAIVGARNASAAGLRLAGDFARGLGEAGVTVVSGMARGVDSAAHAAALETGTAAVLAGGVDHVYPPEAEALYRDIAARGAVLSERRLGRQATARDFPRRNRLVSGLSLGVVVLEAATRSGSLITARLAGEQGREVMAVPGSPLDPRAAGTNRLIRDGAALVRSADDVLDVLRNLPRAPLREPDEPFDEPPAAPDESARETVLELLSPAPVHRDEIARQSGLPAAAVFAALVELEIAGLAVLEPGGTARRA